MNRAKEEKDSLLPPGGWENTGAITIEKRVQGEEYLVWGGG